METLHGYPIATITTLASVLSQLGVKEWTHNAPPSPIEDYFNRANLTSSELEIAQRFAPKSEVMELTQPTGELFTGFRTIGRSWCTTFTLLPGSPDPFVIVTVQYKHGIDKVVMVPPSGAQLLPNESWDNAAHRFVEEETGFVLNKVHALAGGRMQACSGMQNKSGMFAYIGMLTNPVTMIKPNLEKHGLLKILLIPLPDWLKMLDQGMAIEDCATSVTYLALRWLCQMGHLDSKYMTV